MAFKTGTWNATVSTAQGPFMLAFKFAEEGSKLMGSMLYDFMGEVPISDGKIDGKMLSFKLSFEGAPGATMTVSFKGELDGDELKLTSKFEGEAPPRLDLSLSDYSRNFAHVRRLTPVPP